MWMVCMGLCIFEANAQASRLDSRYNIKRSQPVRQKAPQTTTISKGTAPSKRSNARQQNSSQTESGYIAFEWLYNDETIQLPRWLWEEVKDINEQLREKLSPSDYLEILKGEKELYGEYTTKADWQQRERDGKIDELRELTSLRAKLQQILVDPKNLETFSRPHFIAKESVGISFREYIRYTNDTIGTADEQYILSCRRGKSSGDSTIWTFWDARTGRIRNQFYCPTDVGAIIARPSSIGNIYLFGNPHVEVSGERWNHFTTGSYLIVPDKSAFQSCCYKGEEIPIFEDGSKSWNPQYGKIASICGPVPNYHAVAHSSRALKSPWYQKKEADLEEIYIIRDSDDARYEVDAENGKFSLYKKGRGFSLIWDSLAFRYEFRDKAKVDAKLKGTELRIGKELRPSPITKYGNPISPDYVDNNVSSKDFSSHLFVDQLDCPIIPYYAYNDEDAMSYCGILGIVVRQENLLFPSSEIGSSNGLPLPYEGELKPYKECVSGSGRNNCGRYEFEAHRLIWRRLKVHRGDGDNDFLLEITGENDGFRVDLREETRLVRLNLGKKTFTTIKRWENFSSELPSCWVSDKKWFLCSESDYHYNIISFKQGEEDKELAEMYVDPAQGYAIVLPGGQYAGSPGCEKFLQYGDGERVVGMQVLAPWRNRPAEVLEALGGNADDIAALRETTKRWLRKQGFDPDNMPQEPALKDFPAVEVSMPNLFSTSDMAYFTVTAKATANDITKVMVRVDGIEVPQSWSNGLNIAAGEQEELTVEAPLATGQNWIEVTPVDSKGISGDTFRFRTIYRSKTKSDLYIVALGVSDYDNPDLQLQYAAKDATDISKALEQYGSGEKHVLLLTNKQVKDRSTLEKVRDFLSNTTVNDRVVFYVAGHGMLDDKYNYYYAPAGFDPERIDETGIAMDELTACLQNAKARKKLLLLDTCHSGMLGEAGEEKLAMSGVQLPHGVRAIQHRGMKIKKAIGALNTKQKKRYIEDLFSRGDVHRGINIIAGAAGAEYALESGAWRNGVFTSTLIQALQDSNADANKDGKINVEELQNYVTSKVAEQTNGEQKPSSVSSEGCEGFPLSLLLKHQDEEEGKTVENPLPIHESVATQCEASNNELDSIIQDLKGTSYKTPLEKLYQKRVLQLLERIKNGAPVDTVLENANGTTALHNACGLSRVDVVQWLVDHGANVNARTAKGASVETCVGGPNAATIYKILRSANR